MKDLKFYYCEHCKKVLVVLGKNNTATECCHDAMKRIIPNRTDAANEKHVPVVTRDGNKVTATVGSVEHPMTPEHWIQFIVFETEKSFRVVYLDPTDKPTATITEDEKVIAVYEYCNLHGLWKTEL